MCSSNAELEIQRENNAMINASGYLLSIIIPTYNNAELITATLTSVHQSITDEVEIIIVNDGSTDLTEERIKAFYHEHNCNNVKYISQKNQGVAITRNVGLTRATESILVLSTAMTLSVLIISLSFSLNLGRENMILWNSI